MRGGQQQESDRSLDLFYILGILAIVVIALWYTHHKEIVTAIFTLRLYQGFMLKWCMEYFQGLMTQWHIQHVDTTSFEAAMDYMAVVNPDTVSIEDLTRVSNAYGTVFQYVAIVFGMVTGVYMLAFNPMSQFRSTYSMAAFSQKEAVNWPQIIPVINKNLVEESIQSGAWAMALRPLDFCKHNNLVFEGTTKDGKAVARLKRGPALEVFSLQMGPLWNGLEQLPPYILALFAAFAAKASGDDKACKKLLHQISQSAQTGYLDFGGTRELLIQHTRNTKVGRAVGPHAYLYTVMASMLEAARTDGVLASAEFLWLKPLDRRLWFVLNSVGRQTPFCESAGPIGHFKVEQRLRRPLKVPMVEEAVNALEAALAEIVYHTENY